jgi:lysozyme family protein
MTTADEIIDRILIAEGWPQMSNRAADRGGWTKGGITAKSWGEYAGLGRPATVQELTKVNMSQARSFYFDRHIAPYQEVPEPLGTLLADWSVTSWHDDPVRALQIALAKRRYYGGKVDGVFGPVTRRAVKASDKHRLYNEVAGARVRQYVNVALDDPEVVKFMKRHPDSQLHNLRGWTNRAVEAFV